jgi:hypothetical protein
MDSLRTNPDRMFAGRDHVHTAVYRFVAEVREDGGPSAATALDRPFDGVIMVAVGSGEGIACAEKLMSDALPVAAVFTTERVVLSEVEPPPFDLVLGFTVGDPIAAWHANAGYAITLLPTVGFASPFVRTIPGTDQYMEEL